VGLGACVGGRGLPGLPGRARSQAQRPSSRRWVPGGAPALLQVRGRPSLFSSSHALTQVSRLKQEPSDAPDARGEAEDRVQALLVAVTEDLRREGQPATPEPVLWLEGFYSLPAAAPLARVDAYRCGDVYGVDISSGYCVSLLSLRPGEHVLDLCCAPGAKLAMIADGLGLRGSVTGVDCSRQRIGACKQLVHKYKLLQPAVPSAASAATHGNDAGWRCRLFCADGRSFRVGPTDESTDGDDVELVLDTREISARGPRGMLRKRANKSARARERKRQRLAGSAVAEGATSEQDSRRYDKVLVDAECTHDGSVRHLQKLRSLDEWRAYVSNHLSDAQVNRILELQHALIRYAACNRSTGDGQRLTHSRCSTSNGFHMLRPGGTMIYSTCSLSVKQNEQIVEAFLKDHGDASLETIDRAGIPCQVRVSLQCHYEGGADQLTTHSML